MKGGLAVAVELVRDLDPAASSCDVALLLFGREELPAEHNPLPALFDGSTLVHETTLAIVLEPTDLAIHAGCLGNVVARAHLSRNEWTCGASLARGQRAGTRRSRPRAAVRARASNGDRERARVPRSGLSHASPGSGIADNVIPGEATVTLNLRYPPDRDPAERRGVSRGAHAGGGDARDREQRASGARRRLLRQCARSSEPENLDIGPKQAWTNVADFTTRGLDAVNFGPGHTALAHHPDEQVVDRRARHRLRGARTLPDEPDRRRWRVMDLAQRIDELWEADEIDAPVVEEAIAALDRGEVRVAEQGRRRLDGQRVGEEGDPPLLPPAQGGADGRRRPPLPRQDPGEGGLRRARCPRRPTRRGAVRLVPRRRCRPHAGFRQHRCLGRAAHDGRHVGDGRVVRADRRRRPPVRWRRDRRRARASPGAPRDRRGRGLHRLARRRRRRA